MTTHPWGVVDLLDGGGGGGDDACCDRSATALANNDLANIRSNLRLTERQCINVDTSQYDTIDSNTSSGNSSTTSNIEDILVVVVFVVFAAAAAAAAVALWG